MTRTRPAVPKRAGPPSAVASTQGQRLAVGSSGYVNAHMCCPVSVGLAALCQYAPDGQGCLESPSHD